MQEQTNTGSYAIIATGGKQYQAVPGKTIAVEKIDGNPGDEVTFDKVLLKKDVSGSVSIGTPYLETPAKAEIVKQTKDKKIVIFRFKRRKKIRVKNGHRQPKTVIRITTI